MGEQEEKTVNLTLKELEESSRVRGGRTFTQVFSDLKAVLGRGGSITRACAIARIHIDTYYDWLKKSDEFREEMEYQKSRLLTKAEDNISTAIIEQSDIEVSKWLLERRDKGQYSTRAELVGAEDAPPITDLGIQIIGEYRDPEAEKTEANEGDQ